MMTKDYLEMQVGWQVKLKDDWVLIMKLSEKLTIFIGITLVTIFVIGLAWSISTGLAGFWKGLPFWIIVIFCLYLLIYDSLKSIKKQTKTDN